MAGVFKQCNCKLRLDIQEIRLPNFETKRTWNQEHFKDGMGLSDTDFEKLKNEFQDFLKLRFESHPKKVSSLKECLFTRSEDIEWRNQVIQEFRNCHTLLFADHPQQRWLTQQFPLWVTSIKSKKGSAQKSVFTDLHKSTSQLQPQPEKTSFTQLLEYIDVKNPGWEGRLPESFDFNLHHFSNETIDDPDILQLWEGHLPKLFPEPDPTAESVVYNAVFSKLYSDSEIWNRKEAQMYKNGTRVDNLTSATRMEEIGRTLYYAVNKEQADPINTILNIWLDPESHISMQPPQSVESQYNVCNPESRSKFRVGINVTPTGSFVDLHYDIGHIVLSKTFGKCQKVWLLFPPTEKNLGIYAGSVGFPNQLARIGAKLQGGLIVKTTSSDVLQLPPGALHAVFTVVGGFLGGINYSISEGLPVMSRLISAHQPVREYNRISVLEDLGNYEKVLYETLETEHPNLLFQAFSSWKYIVDALKNVNHKQQDFTFVESIVRISLEISRYLVIHPRAYKCGCSENLLDNKSHLKEHFNLDKYELYLEDLKRNQKTDTQREKRKRK